MLYLNIFCNDTGEGAQTGKGKKNNNKKYVNEMVNFLFTV